MKWFWPLIAAIWVACLAVIFYAEVPVSPRMAQTHAPTSPKSASRAISPGWYERADSSAVGAEITSWNMSRGETGVRCLCADGFEGRDEGQTFVVTKAPDHYGDTIGRRFKLKQRVCLNCAD